MGINSRTQTDKGTDIRTLSQNIKRSVEAQLRRIVGLFTGHCHLKGHLVKLGLTNDPTCERCLEEDESATHVLCDREAIPHLWSCHLGQFFMEQGDYYDAPILKVPQFIRSVGLMKC
jgi:hypothetical protein